MNEEDEVGKTDEVIKVLNDPKMVLESYQCAVRCNDYDGMKLFGSILKSKWDVDVDVEEELYQLDFDIARGYFADQDKMVKLLKGESEWTTKK